LGFALCGSSLSMVVFAASGQLFTAVTRRLLLRKGMTTGQTLGVCLVALGLVVRSAGNIPAAALLVRWPLAGVPAGASSSASTAAAMTAAHTGIMHNSSNSSNMSSNSSHPAALATAQASAPFQSDLALGVLLVVLSSLGYSLLGCLYEWLSAVRGPHMSHAQVATSTSLIGLAATSAYQLGFTRRRWGQLVAERMEARGLGWGQVLPLYGCFGALFTVHSLVQGAVLQRSGATAV
ncbi:hypothetical protein Agub_g9888, partial [Astrephomene gubernaculifera]